MLNLIGSIVYLATAALCLRAPSAAGKARGDHGHRAFWFGAAAFFCGLAAMRTFGAEDLFIDAMRSMLLQDGAYAMRRDVQSGAAAFGVLAFAAAGWLAWNFRDGARRSASIKAVRWATLGITIMTGTVILRLISFHAMDQLLHGPLHLNWFLDIGATVLTGWAAIRYVQAADRPATRAAGRVR